MLSCGCIAGVVPMRIEEFSSIPPRQRVALLDLVETGSTEASHTFATVTKQLAAEVGGGTVLANETLVPMTIPDEASTERDEATRLLVVSDYPTTEACRTVLARRAEVVSLQPSLAGVRTYAAQPWGRLQEKAVQTFMKLRTLLSRTTVPRLAGDGGAEALGALVRGSAIHGELPEIGVADARWSELVELAGDRPIWMLNFLRYRPTAIYPAARESDGEHRKSTSGARAYARYGEGLVGPLTRVGGHVAWTSRAVEGLPGTDDAEWDQIAIAFYPSPGAMLTMLCDPEYKAAHVHREAGLARTRLVATQPLKAR